MVYIKTYSIINAMGNNAGEVAGNLNALKSPGLKKQSGWLTHGRSTTVGAVMLPLDENCFGEEFLHLREHNSRNNRLIAAAIMQIRPQIDEIIEKYGEDRVGVVMGTSTSGLDETNRALEALAQGKSYENWSYSMQELGDPSRFVSKYLKLQGPSYTISTACSSSTKSLISAARLIKAGICDAVIAGGADTLSRMPINGFDSMGILSYERCLPFCADRCGINIGEGAGIAVLTKEPCKLALLGYGESSDAYHISSPKPEGTGAIEAMTGALVKSGLKESDIGYINLHGTATVANDRAESAAVAAVFGDRVPSSSIKYLTGHTLGAAGITSALMSALIIDRDLPLPSQDFSLSPYDETLTPCGILREQSPLLKKNILINSFAFGGNNASLIIGESRE